MDSWEEGAPGSRGCGSPGEEEGEAVGMCLIEVCSTRELGGSSSGFEPTL